MLWFGIFYKNLHKYTTNYSFISDILKRMYKLSNYLLSMQSHWMINHTTYQAVQDSIPQIVKYKSNNGMEDMGKTPVHDVVTKIYPEIYRVPLFRRHFCTLLLREIEQMHKEIGFAGNEDEDILRHPIFNAIWQRDCRDPASIQIANYNLKEKQQGAWHHDESADISVVVPLNTGKYKGGGTAFHNYGEVPPLPTGHALMFPSFNNLHKGLPVQGGDRYLLVFWLCDRQKTIDLYHLLD
jgi:hypothetical protein